MTSVQRTAPNEKPASRRILALDLLRGYFLFDMVLNHLNYWPNLLDWTDARGQLFATGAEGFFLISGIVLGIVRGQKLRDQPIKIASKLLLKRAFQLYATYVVSILVFTFLGWWFFMHNPGLKYGIADPSTPPLLMIWQTLTFQYIYGWADYLRMYAVFLLLSPLVIWLLRKGYWWIVMGASALVWAVAPRPDWPANTFTQPYHWQLLFFAGMTIGFNWNAITAWWQSISLRVRKVFIPVLVTLTGIAVAFNVFLVFGTYFGPGATAFVNTMHGLLATPFDKENLGFWRVIYSTACFGSGLWLFTRFDKLIKKYTGWLLIPFGTNSLYVYTVSAFLIFFVQLLVPSGSTNLLINAALTFALLGAIWLMIRFRVLFKVIPR